MIILFIIKEEKKIQQSLFAIKRDNEVRVSLPFHNEREENLYFFIMILCTRRSMEDDLILCDDNVSNVGKFPIKQNIKQSCKQIQKTYMGCKKRELACKVSYFSGPSADKEDAWLNSVRLLGGYLICSILHQTGCALCPSKLLLVTFFCAYGILI